MIKQDRAGVGVGGADALKKKYPSQILDDGTQPGMPNLGGKESSQRDQQVRRPQSGRNLGMSEEQKEANVAVAE